MLNLYKLTQYLDNVFNPLYSCFFLMRFALIIIIMIIIIVPSHVRQDCFRSFRNMMLYVCHGFNSR
jgi:hypothetical protein